MKNKLQESKKKFHKLEQLLTAHGKIKTFEEAKPILEEGRETLLSLSTDLDEAKTGGTLSAGMHYLHKGFNSVVVGQIDLMLSEGKFEISPMRKKFLKGLIKMSTDQIDELMK